MSSINPPQTTLQHLYTQLGNNVQNTKSGPIALNELHNLGFNANLLQNLRNDLSAVVNGSNPERALDNLMGGLQQILASTNAGATEWPSDKPLPEGGTYTALDKNGQAKEFSPATEWPSDKPLPEGGTYTALDKNGQAKEFTPATEWPSDKPLPEGGAYTALDKNGQAKEFTPAKEWPSDKPLPDGGKYTALHKDGQAKEIDASEIQRSELANFASAVRTSADTVISNLKGLLDAQAAGGDISPASADLHSALQSLASLASNPAQVRDALRKSIDSLT